MNLLSSRSRPVMPAGSAPAVARLPRPPKSSWTLKPVADPAEARAAARLVGPVAHEMRNFLAGMRLSLEVLNRSVEHDPKGASALALLRSETEDLSRLVGDLLDAARVDAGKLELRMQVCVLQEIAAQAVQMCRPSADAWEQRLVLVCSEAPIHVRADPLRLRQALTNLILNAVRHSPPGGHIRVEAQARAGWGVLRVEDNGAGMAAETAARIFNAYERGEAESAGDGLGIGLYLVRSIAKLHGGRVLAESEGPGLGSRFTIELPLNAG